MKMNRNDMIRSIEEGLGDLATRDDAERLYAYLRAADRITATEMGGLVMADDLDLIAEYERMEAQHGKTVRIDAAPYTDYDDCLTAAADAYAEAHNLQGWDLDPRWEDDQRNAILLTVQLRSAVKLNSYRITSKAGGDFGVYQGATAEDAFAAMVVDGGDGTDTDGDSTAGTMADWRIEEVVTIGNWTGPVDAARNLMDDEIAESLHGTVDTEQEFADRYREAHLTKYGEEFIVN